MPQNRHPAVRDLLVRVLDVKNKTGCYAKMRVREKPRNAIRLMKLRFGENNLGSPLIRLPPEIRNRIYHFVFGNHHFSLEGRIDDQTKHPVEHDRARAVISHLTLLSVSRQIHVETALLPFKMCTFQFEQPATLRDWASSISEEARGKIASIHIDVTANCKIAHQITLSNPSPIWYRPPEESRRAWWDNSFHTLEFPNLQQLCIHTTMTRLRLPNGHLVNFDLTYERGRIEFFLDVEEPPLQEKIESTHPGINVMF